MTRTLRLGKPAKVTAAIVAAVGLVVGGVVGGVAIADHNSDHKTFSGGGDTGTRVATDRLGYGTTASNTWENVPGSSLSFTVPSGKTRLVQAFFSAESQMYGGSWCAVRIVAKKTTSSTLYEFYPRAGDSFAFDTADTSGGDTYEAHAMKRALRLGSASWSARVQVNAVGGGFCYLDDWYFDVEIHTTS